MLDLIAVRTGNGILKEELDSMLKFLPGDVKDEICNLHNHCVIQRSIVGNILVRVMIMKRVKDIDNLDIVIKRTKYGKPFLPNIDKLHFNISHSGEWIIGAIDDFPVGIDIELIQPINIDIAKRFFSNKEYNELISLHPEKRPVSFYKLWTMKESYLKKTGKGLSQNLKSLPYITDEILSVNKSIPGLINCFFKHYFLEKRYVISVCTNSNEYPSSITVFKHDDLLKEADSLSSM